ncbi:transposase [Sorangium cellulosum]|nr:transposase [Sorangium cellulosum]
MPNILPTETRLRVLAALVDGNSERATERLTGASLKTIRKFALRLGEGAQHLHNRLVRDLTCSSVQFDEVWSYIAKKQARVTPNDPPDIGEAYTYVALDTTSRLAITWHVGRRDEANTRIFMEDLRSRFAAMPSMLTSDGFAPYVPAVAESFGLSVNYGQTVKNYRSRRRRDDDHRYEPPRNPFITKRTICGSPDLDRASTSYVERNNGTMRHHIGRMRRLCLAFSKKIENHRAAVALNYAHYNFCHVVKTLRVTPAMQAGITDHIWSLEEFMEAALAAAPTPRPEPQPLQHPRPEGPARELPNGRGFLRLV